MNYKSDKPLEEDIQWMSKALSFAENARNIQEVPVGAIIVYEGKIIGQGYNRREIEHLAIRHAEIDAINAASKLLGSWRLINCTLYVTLEPCLMCAGALIQSRVTRVVFGAHDPKGGAMGSLFNVHDDPRLNHQIRVTGGVLGEESAMMLKAFFKQKRTKNSLNKP